VPDAVNKSGHSTISALCTYVAIPPRGVVTSEKSGKWNVSINQSAKHVIKQGLETRIFDIMNDASTVFIAVAEGGRADKRRN
jgi:hypothetical protein